MTISKIIGLVKGALKEYSDDTLYEDEYIWEIFNIMRADILEKESNKKTFINPQNYIKFCMELEQSVSHECGCIVPGCAVLRTVKKLPRFLTDKQKALIRIFTLNNSTIDLIDDEEYEIFQDHPIYSKKPLAAIVNDYLIIYNTLDLEVIQVSGLWEDILEIQNAQYCTEPEDDGPECINVYEINIGLDKKLVKATLLETLKFFNIPESLREDLANDAVAELMI